MDYPIPTESAEVGIFSWAPDMQRGFATDGDRLNTGLYWFTQTGTEPFKTDIPTSDYVAWSPDGKTIAWDGAPGSGSGSVMGALTAKSNLYLMDPDGGNQRMIVKGYFNASGLAWSPDSRWLLFIGRFPDYENGAWVVEVASGARRFLAAGDFQWPAWSPDGRQVVMTQYGGFDEITLVTLDVSALGQ